MNAKRRSPQQKLASLPACYRCSGRIRGEGRRVRRVLLPLHPGTFASGYLCIRAEVGRIRRGVRRNLDATAHPAPTATRNQRRIVARDFRVFPVHAGIICGPCRASVSRTYRGVRDLRALTASSIRGAKTSSCVARTGVLADSQAVGWPPPNCMCSYVLGALGVAMCQH